MDRLSVMISTIDQVKELVPIEAAKAVLSAISFILTTVQVSHIIMFIHFGG